MDFAMDFAKKSMFHYKKDTLERQKLRPYKVLFRGFSEQARRKKGGHRHDIETSSLNLVIIFKIQDHRSTEKIISDTEENILGLLFCQFSRNKVTNLFYDYKIIT